MKYLDFRLVTLSDYCGLLRFCTECKNKVLRAYNMLIDDPESSGATARQDRHSNGSSRALFKEVKTCAQRKHIHVPSDEKYLKELIERAEPELAGK